MAFVERNDPMPHDAIVVGGSYAGMSAALQLVRARRDVLVIDAGLPRNRVAAHAHGFLGQDGTARPRSPAAPATSSAPTRRSPGPTPPPSAPSPTATASPS
jgi:glycine/D-amino acid oxidase-like deaminating enzyme